MGLMDMQRFAIRLSYDGTPFSGWARQPNQPSVQQAVEEALFTITRTDVRTVVAGRTDAGGHASGQRSGSSGLRRALLGPPPPLPLPHR